MKNIAGCLLMAFVFSAGLRAQDVPAEASRAEQIENQQAVKAQAVSPDLPPPAEQTVEHIEKDVRHVLQGERVRLTFGGIPMPSGLALGPEVEWQNANDTVRATATAVGSIRQFYSIGTGLELPRLTHRHLDLTLKAGHSDMPQLDFYGEGPNSVKGHRTDYRREDTRLYLGLTWPASKHVKAHCDGEQLWLNVGPGISDTVTSTNRRFGPAEAPGVDIQSNFFIA